MRGAAYFEWMFALAIPPSVNLDGVTAYVEMQYCLFLKNGGILWPLSIIICSIVRTVKRESKIAVIILTCLIRASLATA